MPEDFRKKNEIYWREKLPLTDERLGLEPYRGTTTLQKGELVIIDNDLIFDENNSQIGRWNCALQKEFEAKYQLEKKINNSFRHNPNLKKTTKKKLSLSKKKSLS